MILTHKITLSLNNRDGIQSIDAVQGDTARAVELTLLENGLAWAVPEDVRAVIRYRRHDVVPLVSLVPVIVRPYPQLQILP